MSRKLQFAIFGNCHQPKKSASILKLLDCLKQQGAEVLMEQKFHSFLTVTQQLSVEGVTLFNGSDFDADFVLSLGGDGTFLRAASMVGAKQVPILGVNMGRLGFLADAGADDFEQTLDALYHDDFSLEDRALIRVETNGVAIEGCPCALNDVAILKRDTASMISIRTSINGE